jgi:preprotein translocase subunit SecG
MDAIITTLHVIVCIFLVAVVLLQRGKGSQVGAVFGGGAGATMFGSRGAGNFLTKLTTGAAVVYMLTSLSLSYLGITGASQRLFDDESVIEAEAPEPESLFEEIETVPAETVPEPTDEAAAIAEPVEEAAAEPLADSPDAP